MQTDCFPDAIPDWRKRPLSALAAINPSYPVRKGQECPFVEMAAVGENFGGIRYFDERRLEGSGLTRFRQGDTLFAKITPCPENGKVAYVSECPAETGLGSTEFIVLSPRNGCHPKFLYYLLTSHEVRGRAVARMEGSTGRQRIPEDVFRRRLLVPVPPTDEQAAIASALDVVDTAIERTRAAAKRAQALKTALTQQLFAEGIRNDGLKKTSIGLAPDSWEIVPLGAVVTSFQYGLSVPMQSTGDIPILRMGNIQAGDVVLNDLKFVSLPDAMIKPYIVNRGDVLFNRTNSQELVGKVGVYREDESVVFASYLIRLVTNTELVDNYFLGQLLSSYPAQCRIRRYATPGVQQVNINATNLSKVMIPLPVGSKGIDEQREIARVLESADDMVRVNMSRVDAQLALKRSLMHHLFTGKVRVGSLKLNAVLSS